MIRYCLRIPGGESYTAKFIRLWWLLVHLFHTVKFLVKQAIESHRRHHRNTYRMQSRGQGETVVITGATRGIGVEIVKKLLQYNMHVIIGCRDHVTGRNVLKRIRQRGITTGTAETIPLDLTSLNSVREFAYKILAKNVPVNALINNAGVFADCYGVTVENLEQHFQINYLAPFLLTNLLLSRLHESGSFERHSRVINVSSVAHFGAYIDLKDLQMTRFYSSHKAYMDSKFCQIASSNFLDSLLKYNSANVRSYAVHPGFTKTDTWRFDPWIKRLGVLQQVFVKRAEQAAETVLHTLICPDLETKGGSFISNGDIVEPMSATEDHMLQRRLWNISCRYVELDGKCVEETNHDQLCPSMSTSADDPFASDSKRNDYNMGGKSSEPYCLQPYYEYLIHKLFTAFNVSKRGWLCYIQLWSILLLQKLDRLNSHFKFLNVYE